MIIRHDLETVLVHVPKCAGKLLRMVFLRGVPPDAFTALWDYGWCPRLRRARPPLVPYTTLVRCGPKAPGYSGHCPLRFGKVFWRLGDQNPRATLCTAPHGVPRNS